MEEKVNRHILDLEEFRLANKLQSRGINWYSKKSANTNVWIRLNPEIRKKAKIFYINSSDDFSSREQGLLNRKKSK